MAFLGFLIPILISVGVEAGLAWLSKAINPTPTSGRLGQDDFHSLESAYTLPLPKCWGTERVPANITWVSPVREHKYNVGSGLFSDGVDVFYYTQDVEYSFTLGPAKAFVKIWLGDKVIYDQSGLTDDGTSAVFGNNLALAFFNLIGSSAGAAKDRLLDSYELFLGTETQQPSAIVSAVEGFGTVPADRGIVKLVIKGLNLTKLGGNSLPASSAIIQFADYTPAPASKIAKAYPTSCKAYKGAPPGVEMLGGDPAFTFDTGLQNARSARLESGFLIEETYRLEWAGFQASIPAGATVTGIFGDVTASLSGTPVGFEALAVLNTATSANDALYETNSALFDSTVFVGTHSVGSSLGDLSDVVIRLTNSSTVSGAGEYIARTSVVSLDIHYTVDLVPPTGTTLAQIVADLCVEAGLTEDQFDVTELAATLVKGFKTEQKAIRDVVRELMDVYPFDGYESDGILKFVLRSGNPVVTIGEDDLVLSGDSDNGYRISEPITQEDEIPMKVDVHYADIDRDFQDNVQHSKRIIEPAPTMESITIKSISTNVVMNANEGAQTAERNLWEPWSTRRGGQYQLMPKHLRLDAADKVQVNYKNQTLIQRIKQANLGAGLGIQLSTVSHDSDVYTSSATGSSSGGTFPVPIPSSADPGVVNVPVMFEPPSGLVPPGAAGALWIQVSGEDPDYDGCEVFISTDAISYASLGDMLQGITGFLVADYPSASDPDAADTLSVDLTECSGNLPTRTRSTADGFFDLTYVGVASSPVVRDYELVCPTIATERPTDNIYDLTSYIRRGSQGSTILDHPTSSRFADLTGALKINLSPAWIGITLYFKFAAYNTSHVHPANQQAGDLSGCTVYPYSPIGIAYQVYVDGNGVSTDLIATIDGSAPFSLSPGV